MPENVHNLRICKDAFDPSMQTESVAFDASEMIACDACKRLSPPNRPVCLYCAAQLELPSELATKIAPDLRRLDSWERGFNIVLRHQYVGANVARAAHLLSMDLVDITRVAGAAARLPVARVGNKKQTDLIVASLLDIGFDCTIVSDESLAEEKPNRRINGLEFLADSIAFTDFNTGNVKRIPIQKIALIVNGVISTTKIDSLEKRRRGGESKVIDESAVSADDLVLDIYVPDEPLGFRLLPAGFDFSCLGDKMGLPARENWGRLIEHLKNHVPNVKFIDDYPRVRPALGIVWPVETRAETKGLIQTGFGKREFGSVMSTSNLSQFNKYSRLQRHLYESETTGF